MCGGHRDRKKWKVCAGDRSPAFEELSDRQDRGSDQAAAGAPIRRYRSIARIRWRRRWILGEPRPASRGRGTESPQLPRAGRSDRCQRRQRTCRGLEQTRRSDRQAFAQAHDHAGERLSRPAAGRDEPGARGRQDAVAAGAAVRRVSAGGARVQTGRERLLELSVRSHDPQPGDQGVSRPRTGAGRRRIAAGQRHRRTKRISLRCRRNRESDCLRLSHRSARSHCEPRSDGCGHRQALCRAAPAMSHLRQQETAESAPGGDADRDRRRQQAHHDQRWISHRDLQGHRGALPQACEPADRRGYAARADRGRSADEHQFFRLSQFLRAGPKRRSAQVRTERRQLRQGLHGRAGRGQRADGGDRALFGHFPG